jgi:ABC-type xylose transport system substrate-binding protein
VAVTAKNIKDTVIKDGFLTKNQICSGTYAKLCTKYGI